MVTSKACSEQWASFVRSLPGISLHVYTDTLSLRRKMGPHRIKDFDVVVTTFDVLKAREVLVPEDDYDEVCTYVDK